MSAFTLDLQALLKNLSQPLNPSSFLHHCHGVTDTGSAKTIVEPNIKSQVSSFSCFYIDFLMF
jgi:hypothetical protein